jgi:hypothetical protein
MRRNFGNIRDKTVAAFGYGFDKPWFVFAVAESFSQQGDSERKVSFRDYAVRPYRFDELFFFDQPTVILDQRLKEYESLGRDRNMFLFLSEHFLLNIKNKLAKLEALYFQCHTASKNFLRYLSDKTKDFTGKKAKYTGPQNIMDDSNIRRAHRFDSDITLFPVLNFVLRQIPWSFVGTSLEKYWRLVRTSSPVPK